MKMSSLSGEIATCVDSMLEVRVAAVHVERAQLLEVALQALARVAVVLLVPGEPVRRLAARSASRISLSVNDSLPTTLIWRILARLPSLMSIFTLHAVAGLILDGCPSTRTPYLPRLKYCSVRYCCTSSSTERSKVLPVARPTLRRDFCRSSVLMSLLPVISKLSMDGRSSTTTTSVSPSWRSCTSRKKPVL